MWVTSTATSEQPEHHARHHPKGNIKDTIVKAEVCGEKIDPDRHEIKQDIAAVASQHGRMEKTGSQWIAQLVFEF